MAVMLKIIIFVLATIGITWVSRSSLRNVQTHGFYRFFAWETILISFLINMNYWFVDPFSLRQIISWSFLIVSLAFIYQGVQLFRRQGNLDQIGGHRENNGVGYNRGVSLYSPPIL
jgi:hypothetical protein